MGSFIYYYGNRVDIKNGSSETINADNKLFGSIFRKYTLSLLSENINKPWQPKEVKSTLRIVKEISEDYEYSEKIRLQYELIIDVHHWRNTNFGLAVDLKINIIDIKNSQRISYPGIKDMYGEGVSNSIWYSVQAFRKHLTSNGKKYATAMQDKFNLLTNSLKEAFDSSGDEKSFDTSDGKINITFKPIEVVEVSSND